MSCDKEDSDFEVFLTSKEYTRILSIEKDSKKEKEMFRSEKQRYQAQIQGYKTEIKLYQNVIKEKNAEIDNLLVECLRLKKLRITNEDEIRNFKEEQLKIKQANLTQLQQSVRENKEMKQKRISDESVIMELKAEIKRIALENSSVVEKMAQKTDAQLNMNVSLKETIEKLNKQLENLNLVYQKSQESIQQQQVQIDKNKTDYQALKTELEKLQLENKQLADECKQQKSIGEKIKLTYQSQLKNVENNLQQIARCREQVRSKLQDQANHLNTLLIQANLRVQQLMKQQLKTQNKNKNIKQQHQKLSSRVLEALNWVKQGILNPHDLKQQIQNILTLQKQYQDIIYADSKRMKSLQDQLIVLKKQNQHLSQNNQKYKQRLARFSNIVDDLSEMKVGNDENSLMSQNLALKQQIEKLRVKLQRVTVEFDESFMTFNYSLGDMKLKYEKDLAGYTELQNEIQAMKFQHQQLLTAIELSIQTFEERLKIMQRDDPILNPAHILATLKKSMPNLKH